MPKKCASCANHTNNAPYVVKRGARFYESLGSAQPSSTHKSRAERALKILGSNLGLVLPILLLFIAQILVGGFFALVLLAFGIHLGFHPFTVFPYGFVVGSTLGIIAALAMGILTAIFVSILVVEARNAVMGVPYTIGEAWKEVKAKVEPVFVVVVVGAILFALWSFVPFIGFLLDLFTMMYLIMVFCVLFSQTGPHYLSTGFNKLIQMASKDALTFVALFIASALSLIPIIDLLALPYAVLLCVLFIRES
jgi:hypothetical protein